MHCRLATGRQHAGRRMFMLRMILFCSNGAHSPIYRFKLRAPHVAIFPPMDLDRTVMPLPRLPVKVLSYIIEFVDHPKDLLAFALTARALCAAIIPHHIDYRRISCGMRSDPVWKHLLDTPNACSRIRYLNVKLVKLPEIPRVCNVDSDWRTSHMDVGDYTLFLRVLPKMVNLKVLKFGEGLRDNTHAIFEAVDKAGCKLEELEIDARRRPRKATNALPSSQRLEEGGNHFSLPSLRKYTIANDTPPFYMLKMLNAPNLTHLKVINSPLPAFLSGHWQNLQHLVFFSNDFDRTENDMQSFRGFFRLHPKLITLSTGGALRPGWAIESGDFLPNLRSFGTTAYASNYGVTTITSHIAARLTHLHMTIPMYSYLKKRGTILSNLETCIYLDADPGVSLQGLVDLIPNIKKLFVEFGYFRTGPYSQRYMSDDEIMERIPSFAKFKFLHVLLGPFDNTRISVNTLCKLLYDFPSILYTRTTMGGFGPLKYLRLERDNIAKVMRYQCQETFFDECDQRTWGGFFK